MEPVFYGNLVYKYKTIIGNVSEYDQEISQSQTADKPVAPRGRATQQSRNNKKTNKALFPIKMIAKLERTLSTS